MADKVTTNFPKVGKANAHAKNTSASATGRATSTPRGGPAGMLADVMAPSRRHTSERLGSVGMPRASYAPQEDPAASANLRNTRKLAGAMKYPEAFSAPIQYGT